ncbi:MAG: hypothetical protein R3A52_03950 [Polyangiales bacterium]
MRPLALALVLVACSAPTYSRAPSPPAYSALPSAPSLGDTGPYRDALSREDQRLRAGAPPAAAALHDAVEQIVSELGQACTPSNPGGDGLHWSISCATQTLFAPGSSSASPEVVQRWRAVGRIVGDLLRRQLPGAQRLRVAVSGFADHIQFASPASATACDPLKRAFGADYPAPADDAARNRELSFCRAANMAREIACATLPTGCQGNAVSHAPGLSVGVFGGGTTALDAAPSRFSTRVETPSGTLSCACHPIAPGTLGPSWASQHGRPWNITECPAPVADAPVLFDCADARRVELDLWLDVTAAQREPNRCDIAASDPDARALACLQQAVGASSHQAALQAPTPGAREDRCAAAPNPLGWYAGRAGDAPPCAAEVGR